jgi:hypothetical protein
VKETVGQYIALQAGRSQVQFPMGSLGFLIDLNLPAALMALGYTQTLTETSTRNIFWGVKVVGVQGQQSCQRNMPIVYKFWDLCLGKRKILRWNLRKPYKGMD